MAANRPTPARTARRRDLPIPVNPVSSPGGTLVRIGSFGWSCCEWMLTSPGASPGSGNTYDAVEIRSLVYSGAPDDEGGTSCTKNTVAPGTSGMVATAWPCPVESVVNVPPFACISGHPPGTCCRNTA